ncbi:DUF1007 family protein [Volucribacter amazonae]|uniref:ABC transporter n=1 Tax=Volucribacter amazonae TaxID=256731 RepID=A0A9X4SJZ2_9PAST|nr:DUF1007 family protein [Volucribacter amazonae]MDG6894629.1 ABC transporter [Volucribacter amazonae]
MKKCGWILGFILYYCFCLPTLAHPHAFVEMKNKLLIEQDHLIGFRMQWILDEASSSEMLYDLALSKNDPQKKQAIADEIMQNVVAEHYFSYFYDKHQQPIKYLAKPQNYGARADGHQIVYYFDFLLAKPQLLKNNRFELTTYDPTYYVFMYYDLPNKPNIVQSAVDFSGLPSKCRGDIIEPDIDEQLKRYAQSLDKSQRDEDDTLGAQFAQKVMILCD